MDPRRVDKKVLCDYACCFGRLGMTSDEVYQTTEMEFLQRKQYLNHIQVNKLLSGFALANKGSSEFLQFLEAAFLKLNVSSLKAIDINVMFYGHLLKWDIKSLNFVMLLRTKYSSEVSHFSQQMTVTRMGKSYKELG